MIIRNAPFLIATFRIFNWGALAGAEGSVAGAAGLPEPLGRFMEPSACCSRVMTGFSTSTSDTSMVPPRIAVRL